MVLTTMYSGGSSGSNKSSKPEEDQLYHYPQQQQQRLRRDDHNHASSSLSPQRPRQRELHRRRLDLASLVFVVPWLLLLLLGVEPNRTPATPSTILPVVLVHAFSTTTTAIPAPLFRRNCNYKYNNNKKSYTTASSRRPLSTPTQLHHQQPKQPQHLTAALKRVHRHFQFYQSTGTSTALFHHPPSSSSSSSSTTRLAAATPLENDDSTSNNPPNNIFQTALAKFRARPVALLMIPVIAAFVGWLTNWLAVQMIFYPIRYRSLIPNNIWNTQWNPELPLGLLGWQGIIPCKTRPMTIALTDMVTSQLVTVPEALARLDPAAVATLLSPRVPDLTRDVLPQLLRVPGGALSSLLDHPFLIHRVYRDFCEQLTRAMQEQATTIFSLQNCVVSQMVQNRAKLGELFQLCGQAELDFLTNSGLWFGFLLGIVQMIVALFWDNPWSLSIGGGIVGFATNWLALKWIFEPVDPMKIGPWIVQGKFLKRQKEVAAEFSRYFSNTILSGEQIWKSILTDPETKPAFTKLFTEHFQAFIHKIPWFLRRPLLPGTMERLAGNIVDQLPKHVPVLFPYMNQALGLEQTLRQRMEKMTSRKFERVLHPIFEEDELTLIIAGAVLGFLAGLVQQGLETGTIKLPNVFGFLRRWIAPRFLKLRLRIRSFFSKGTVGGTGDEDGGDDIIGGPMPMRLFPKKQ